MGIFSDILLTVDFDRTMTGPDASIPERNLEAARYFMENGGAFTINTGRSVPMTKSFRDIVPVNAPLLLYNGSAAWEQDSGFTFAHEIKLPMWETLLEAAELFPDMIVELQGADAHYLFAENPNWEAFSDVADCAWGYAKPGDALGPFLKFSLYGPIREANMAHMYEGTPEELRRIDQVEQLMRSRFGGDCEVFRATPRIIDIHAKGVSKLRSARELQQHLGRKILICVGDGENDVSMLQGADYAFCPADAGVADRFENVCECALGAVADVIYKKIPEILSKNLDKQNFLC